MWENVGCGATTGDDSLIVRAAPMSADCPVLTLRFRGRSIPLQEPLLMSVEADPNPGTVVGDTPNIAQKTEPLLAVHTPNFPDLCAGWAPHWSSLPIRPARSCSSAKRATTSIRTSAASRLPWVWPFRVTGWRSARPCRSGSFTTSRPSLPSSNRAWA